jgi:DNA modification methylase
MIHYTDDSLTIRVGDCRAEMQQMDAESVQTCVTSPPYWGLRDYGDDNQLGLEKTPEAYVANMVDVFREVKRVLRPDGTLWLNLGDSYASGGMSNPSSKSTLGGGKDRGAAGYSINRSVPDGLKPKDLVGIPWRVAFALQADGWYLRSDIIWHKPNPMPESVTDRPTKAHEHMFLLAKSKSYYYDHESIKEPAVTGAWDALPPIGGKKHPGENGNATYSGNQPASDGMRNKRDVWTISTKQYAGAHFATFPADLVEPCILAGAPLGGVVLDPFGGSGTTGMVANKLGRKAVLIELNPDYVKQIKARTSQAALGL